MGAANRYGKEAESVMIQGFQNREEITLPYNKWYEERSQKYLRFWGNDYLYLNWNKDTEPRWLPIPENSNAQRMIRGLNRKLQLQSRA